jgi:hypothetical protein
MALWNRVLEQDGTVEQVLEQWNRLLFHPKALKPNRFMVFGTMEQENDPPFYTSLYFLFLYLYPLYLLFFLLYNS